MQRSDTGISAHRALLFSALAVALSWAVALAFRTLHNPLAELEWYGFGFHDERWLVLGYWLTAVSVLFVPLLSAPVLRRWQPSPPKTCGRDATEDAAPKSLWLRMAAALAVYAVWVGPPWNLESLARPMEWHEIVHLGPLQALIVGKEFYLESGTQYGPGMQMMSLHYLERFGVSLLNFREFWMWTNFAGGAVVVAWLARLFAPWPLLMGLLVLRFFSPFHFLRPDAEGSYAFFFGWASCIRYAGALHAVLAMAWVLGRNPPSGAEAGHSRSGERLFLLFSGLVLGLAAQISQENLGCGVVGVALLLGFAWLSGAATWRRACALVAPLCAGFALAIAPIVLFFASAGKLDAFLTRYFEIGAYVASGLSNTPFREPWTSSAGWIYLALPPAALALYALSALNPRLMRRERVLTAGVVIAALTGFAPALLRTDEAHIMAAALPLCLLVPAALSRAGDAVPPARKFALAGIALVLLLPLRTVHAERLFRDVSARVASYRADVPDEIVGDRIGYRYDLESGYSTFSEISLREFIELGQSIRAKVGTRPVVISSAVGTRGHWYFFANLRPWMPDPEPSMTILNNRLRARYLADLDRRGIPCVMSTRPQDAELTLYHRQPGPRREWTFQARDSTFYVSCLEEPPSLAFSFR
jgi:hypothetical protein